jgi:response regulator RpfG family c-di-GMP phosphodiesterase
MNDSMQNLMKFSKTLKVLVVEDNEDARVQAVKMLKNLFVDISVGVNGEDGLKKFTENEFDLVISDIDMPIMDGLEMITKIREIDNDIPIIVFSARNDTKCFIDTINLRITGYILKPMIMNQFLNILKNTLEVIKLKKENQQYKQELENMNSFLEEQVNERIGEIVELNKEIQKTQKEVVFVMGAIGERRSKETGYHVTRVAEYSKLFALLYGLTEEDSEMLKQASPMHDIGKVAIPDDILNKPGVFTEEEFSIMKNHSVLGYEMLNVSSRPLLKLAATIAHEHHEKWDGTGYPQGLSGSQININGRITAIADVFDALGSDRVYKKAWSDEEIFQFFKDQRAKHFDPDLVDIFFDNVEEFLKIRDKFSDV